MSNELLNLKYFIYCRKSTKEDHRQIQSIPLQLRELNQLALDNDLNIVGIFHESASAYKAGRRSSFNQMITCIQKGEANAMLVWHVDRLARNGKEAQNIVQLLEDEVLLEIRTVNVSFHKNSDEVCNLRKAFADAQKQSDINSEKVRAGNYEKLRRGHWPGTPPQGYLNGEDSVTKERIIIADPQRFHLIKQAFHLIIYQDKSVKDTLKTLNKDWHYRTIQKKKSGGKPLAKNTFYKLLSDPFYFGEMHHKEGIFKGQYPAMITKQEFDIVQQKLGRTDKPHQIIHPIPYKDSLTCSKCNGSVTAEVKHHLYCSECNKKIVFGRKTEKCPKCETLIKDMTNPVRRTYTYYTCVNKKKRFCDQKTIRLEAIESTVKQKLESTELIPEFKDWMMQYMDEYLSFQTDSDYAIAKQLEKKVAQLDCQIKNLIKNRFLPDSTVSSDSNSQRQSYYQELEDNLLNEKAELEHKLEQVKPRAFNLDKHKNFNYSQYAKDIIDNSPNQDLKSSILKSLGKINISDNQISLDQNLAFFLQER